MNPWLIALPFLVIAAVLAAHEEPARKIEIRLKPALRTSTAKMFNLLPFFKKGVEYPDTIRVLAEKWAAVFEIPSSWLISQAYVESQNKPLAENPSGATGVLQIKLVRANDLVKWIHKSKWKNRPEVEAILGNYWHGNREDLLNPDLNVMLAAFDLQHLRRKFGDNHELVAAAYNQGEGKMTKVLAAGEPVPRRGLVYIARVIEAKRKGFV